MKQPDTDRKKVVFADEPHPEKKDKPESLAEGAFNEDESHSGFL